MFKNSVLKTSVNTKQWLKAAGIRAGKTMAQTALSMITVGQAVTDINWISVVSVSFIAGLTSVLTSIVGIPEVKEEE